MPPQKPLSQPKPLSAGTATDKPPKVSIITATYNSMRFLPETVDNILCLGGIDFEWILVDDASTDGTADYLASLRDPRITVILNPKNLGVHRTYAVGTAAASGEYLLILDHDDTIPEGSLEQRAALLDQYPQCGLAFGPVNYMTANGVHYRTSRFHFIHSKTVVSPIEILTEFFLSPAYPIKQGCVLVRLCSMERMSGKFDIELFLGISSQQPVAFTSRPCLNYRTFSGQRSAVKHLRWQRFFQFIWARYAIRFLPWYMAPIAVFYRTFLELLKSVWILLSIRRI